MHLAVTAVVAAALFGAAAPIAPAVMPGIPSIYVNYNDNCSFVLTSDGGFTMLSPTPPGTTLPPGPYQLVLHMPNPISGYACRTPIFSFTGPGVNSGAVFMDEAIDTDVAITLQPSSTYIAVDQAGGPSTQLVITTSASGSSSSLLAGTTPPSTTGTGSTQHDLVGSDVAPYRGTLVGSVDGAGKATLRHGGKQIVSLQPGRYQITVSDADVHAGFFVWQVGKPALDLTGVRFTGKKSRTIDLTAGTWGFYAKTGAATRFKVTG